MDDHLYSERAEDVRAAAIVPDFSVTALPNAVEPERAPGIYPLEPRHIPELCDMFAETFRPGRKIRRQDIEACLYNTYLTSPGDRIRAASRVDISPAGRVKGFMGTITLGARHGDRLLRVGVLGNFMARDEDRSRSALRLARATVAQDLDVIFTDTANRTSLDLSRALKFKALPLQSLEWVKILRPCGTVTAVLGRSLPTLSVVLGPLARAGDLLCGRAPFASIAKSEFTSIVDRPVEPPRFAAEAGGFLERFSLKPDWNPAELTWLLDQAARKTRNGPLHLREVADGQGRCLGLYLVYVRSGGVAQVLQILARPSHETEVIGAVIRTAASLGAVAVRGAATPALGEGLMRHAGILYHHVAATVVYSRHPELREVLRSEQACLGGLMGEGWTRLATEEFT